MKRTKRTWLATLLFSLALLGGAACTPTPTPTSIPSPTRTIQLFRTVIVTVPTKTAPPTWTSEPSRTPPPTQTRLPSSTPRPTRTPIPTRTLIGAEPGVVSTEGLLTVMFTPAELDSSIKRQIPSIYFSSTINSASPIEFDYRQIRLTINFNDFTTEGNPADFTFSPRAFDSQFFVDVGTVRAARSTLTTAQIEAGRQLLRYTMAEVLLPAAIRRIAPNAYGFSVIAVSVEPSRLLVSVKLDLSTPTP
jgi:hypothetical protein